MSTTSAGRHHASMPRLLRASQIVLIIGAVACAAAALGPQWLVRVGIGLAIATGVIAVVLAFKHIRQLRREHAARLLKMTKDHGAALTTERDRNAEVVQVLTDRAQTAVEQSKKQRVRIGELNAKVTELTGDNAALRSKVKSRDVTIAGLRETVRSRDTEIQLLRADLDLEAIDAPVGDVHGLPRHLQNSEGSIEDAAGDDELWGDADHPTVVDMRAIEAPMPNLEVDQKLA
ncbi:hypothetical protein FOE78_04080 [Microlunatus elymi]|uniref:Uncharacterized protein n=1 Tax=Microlunatus elymi TaxID=2596828 RepID=A0A516PW67_9ACTN|nr:hypothetical protein [Microlunatus elymi]QDP95201.1 hypothetical protein FOE78_04080 [Microlunatus elymi]